MLTKLMKPLRPWKAALLGTDHQQQLALSATLVAAGVYVVCIVSQWLWVLFGLVPPAQALGLTTTMALGAWAAEGRTLRRELA